MDFNRLGIYSMQGNDPESQLIDRTELSPEELAQINELMAAMGRLRDVERNISQASQRYMKLKSTDMRALHFLMVQQNQGITVTPGMLAKYLEITAASVTKLLDRLEKGGHVQRGIHPDDRRAFSVQISEQTRREAMSTVGRHQASRIHAAAKLSPAEREVVIRFLTETAKDLESSLGQS